MNAKESPSAFTSFSVCLPCFSVSFLLQPPFSFLQCLLFFSVSAPFLSCSPFFSSQRPFSAFVQCPLFLFCRRVALLQPKIFIFSPKRFSAQKSLFFSPIHVCLSVKMKSNRLPQNQEGPTFHANSQAKKKKIFLQPPFIQNPIFSPAALSLLFE